MKISAILEPLIAAGVPGDVILATVRAFENQNDGAQEKSKEKARERWRRWKNKQDTNVGKRLQTDANVSKQLMRDRDARGEDNLQTKNITGQEERKKTPRDELAAVLDPERAAAVVDHRQKIRRPLTGHAAKLLANRLSQAPDPNSAADLMIEKGWQSFELEWLSRPARQATAPPPQQAQDFNTILDAMQGKHHEPEHSGPTIEASFARGDRGGAADIVQLHAFSARG